MSNIWAANLSRMTAQQAAAAILLSPEVQRAFANNNAFVAALYRRVLAREGSVGEITGWVRNLNRGMTRREVILHFLQSRELGTVLIKDYYSVYLGRAADAAGLNPKVTAYLAGTQTDATLAVQFLASKEFINKSRGSIN